MALKKILLHNEKDGVCSFFLKETIVVARAEGVCLVSNYRPPGD